MKFSIHSRASMRSALFVAVAGLALGAVPAIAQQRAADAKTAEPAKPITQQDVGAKDVALTPLSDLNLRKGEIPQLLLDAQDDPYTLAGMARCPQIAAAVGELDAVLGDDIDVAQAKKQSMSAGRVAQSVAGSFIPFRGVIREISGANSQERKVQAAIYAGTARRAFLKGIGQQRGCRYPARSATPQIIAAAEAEAAAAQNAKNQPKPQHARRSHSSARTVSHPVVQKTR
ncbi:MAG: hypothetical protein JWQ16_434 [Novosphingobium sp.]|nr:hypothetical protein [Novosphingobium sp.]